MESWAVHRSTLCFDFYMFSFRKTTAMLVHVGVRSCALLRCLRVFSMFFWVRKMENFLAVHTAVHHRVLSMEFICCESVKHGKSSRMHAAWKWRGDWNCEEWHELGVSLCVFVCVCVCVCIFYLFLISCVCFCVHAQVRCTWYDSAHIMTLLQVFVCCERPKRQKSIKCQRKSTVHGRSLHVATGQFTTEWM